MKILERGNWPLLYWGQDGNGAPAKKHRLEAVKAGSVPTTFWVDPGDHPLRLDSMTWPYQESGRSRDGVEELDSIIGPGHNFETVKPLKLFKKIVQIWCPKNGIVFDPFAGSGTTAHAVLDLNQSSDASRRFILIEQGNTEKGDHYAQTLTADRVRRVITGDWASGNQKPLPGGCRFIEMKRERIDADAVNALAREEMTDLLLTSYWDKSESAKSYLRRLPVGSHQFLFAVNGKNEGFFLVWDTSKQPSALNRDVFRAIVEEAKAAGLAARYHVYASTAPYTGASVEFYKIPDKVLEHIGFSAKSDAYNNEPDDV